MTSLYTFEKKGGREGEERKSEARGKEEEGKKKEEGCNERRERGRESR